MMTTEQCLALADLLANDLLLLAQDQNLSRHDLLMVTALAERLLQKSTCAPAKAALRAIFEADATLEAVTEGLDIN